MLVFLGDIHGAFRWLPKILEHVPKDATIIQVGDFGFWPGKHNREWRRIWKQMEFEKPMYVIDGNHECHSMFAGITEPTELWDGAMFVPRGTVLDVDHGEGITKIGFMGGASSIDKHYQVAAGRWFEAECITNEELMRMNDVDSVDILVTHSPPHEVIQRNFDNRTLLDFGLPPSWVDPSAIVVENLWRKLGKPPLICGHMHRSVVDGTCRILDINEVWMYRPW